MKDRTNVPPDIYLKIHKNVEFSMNRKLEKFHCPMLKNSSEKPGGLSIFDRLELAF